jgi:hypothetical protein
MMGSRMTFRGHRLLCAVAFVAALTATPAVMRGMDQPSGIVRYRGIHPLSPQVGEFCYIDVIHVHNKRPSDLRVYRELPNDEYLFVGDPVGLGYDGPKVPYFGPHPLGVAPSAAGEKLYCYIRGPHFHADKPASTDSFVLKDGVNWFMGSFSPEFERDRHYLWVNDSPAMTSYQPPQVGIASAPPGYRLPALAALQPGVGSPEASPSAKASAKGAGTGTKSGHRAVGKQRVR